MADHLLSGNTNKKNESDFNLKDILQKYLSYYWLFILALIITIFSAWIYIRYTTPLYKVSATLLLKDNDNRLGSQGGELFTDLLLARGNTNKINEIEVLRSRTLMIRVVKALGLQKECKVIANIKTTDTYGAEPFEWDIIKLRDSSLPFSQRIETNDDGFLMKNTKIKVKFGEVFENKFGVFRLRKLSSFYHESNYKEFEFSWNPEVNAAAKYAGNLQVKPVDDRANILTLSYITDNPKLGATILNQLMEEYNNANIDDKNLINKKALAFIDDRLAIVEKQLDSVENNLQLYKTNRNVIDLGSQSEFYFNSLKTTLDNASTLEIDLNLIGLLENYLLDKKNNLQRVPTTLGLNDPTLLQLTSAYNQLIVEREKQIQTGAAVNSVVIKDANGNIEETRLKLLENLQNLKRGVENSLKTINSKSGLYRTEISRIPEKERESREKTRQQQIKQNLYLYLLQRKEESALSQASTIASSKVVDNALNDGEKVSPKVINIYSIALFIGLFFPILIIYLSDLFNDKVTTKIDIEKNTTAPIIAEIGHNSSENALIFSGNERSLLAEQFRMLRSNLKFLLGDNKTSPIILVTSSVSGEGKSFVSTNLAASLAIMGHKTVILEFDLRKPKIMAGLKLSSTAGLSNFLIGDASPSTLPSRVPDVANLFVISSGPIPPNPSELLQNKKIAELFTYLKQKFDYIIVDTAPVGLVSDAYSLSSHVDASLYIIRQGYTLKKQMSSIQDLYENKRLPSIGLLVNDIRFKGRYKGYYGYGGGGGTYYGYSYGNEYFGEKKVRWPFGFLKG
ncbi:MAG: polysaccharide biosynthesis tyrosine autokinase [Agriterribacter sp.]